MGKLPAIFLAVIALWLALDLYQHGPEDALGGILGLFFEPQYGEADRPTRSGSLADKVLEEGSPWPNDEDR